MKIIDKVEIHNGVLGTVLSGHLNAQGVIVQL